MSLIFLNLMDIFHKKKKINNQQLLFKLNIYIYISFCLILLRVLIKMLSNIKCSYKLMMYFECTRVFMYSLFCQNV